MTRVIAIALHKGGVGKTTTAQHLAHGLARQGRKVLMLDLDSQGSLSRRYDLTKASYSMADVIGVGDRDEVLVSLEDAIISTHAPNVDLVPSSASLTDSDTNFYRQPRAIYRLDTLLREKRWPYDFVVIDTPPGKSRLLVAGLVASDELVVPVQLSPMGFEGFAQIDKTVTEAREEQMVRGPARLVYTAIVPTFYQAGQRVSDVYLETLQEAEHPDYAGESLPLSTPINETTAFEQASAPRKVRANGKVITRGLTIWEMGNDDVVIRAANAYLDLAQSVDSYV